MRFGLVHRVMTDALAALGILAVVSTSSMSPWANAVVLVGLVVSLAIPEAWQSKPQLRQFATLGPLALFVIQAARLLMGRSMLDIAVEFAALLQVVRISTRRGAAHDQQIIVLALLHFVAGTVLGGGLSYGLCFLGFLMVAPGALVLSHLRREVEGNYRQGARDRTGLPVDVPRILRSRRVVGRGFLLSTCLLAVPIFVFTATLFVMFPRVGLSLLLLSHPRGGRMVGFSDKVDLGEVGVLRSDPSIALRFDVADLAEPPPQRLTLRLRGTAFDSYNGRAWSRTQVDRRNERNEGGDTVVLYRHPTSRDRRITIDLEPIDPPVVFLPPRTVAMRVRTQGPQPFGDSLAVRRGPEGELRYGGSDAHGLRYEVFVSQDQESLPDTLTAADRARYLGVPADLPRRLADLAHQWADGQPTKQLKARAIEDHLKREYGYDTASPSGGKPQPLDHFLFESRRGHCEFFSTAMAMMLREVGIPSRNVTGFVGGTYNRFGRYYAVREGDAHSWVEAYIDESHAWVPFDPTPSAGAQPLQQTTGAYVYMRDLLEAMSQRWNRYVVGYDLRTQTRLFDDLGRKYNGMRQRAGLTTGPLDKLTQGPVVAAGLVLTSIVAYAIWKRRKKPVPKGSESDQKRAKELEAAAQLYRQLEVALAHQGLHRAPATPPLRHATELGAKRHPLAPDVARLTDIYLETRFGGRTLTQDLKADFDKTLRVIKAYKAAPPEPA
jgi:protein-glutamine gamma-glutamyltransferase